MCTQRASPNSPHINLSSGGMRYDDKIQLTEYSSATTHLSPKYDHLHIRKKALIPIPIVSRKVVKVRLGQRLLSKCGFDGSMYETVDKDVHDRTIDHNTERLSLLKGGVVYSNTVVTVSLSTLKKHFA